MAMSRSFGGTLLTTRSPNADLAAGDILQSRDHAQQGRLSAPGRPDQDDELAVVDRDVDPVDDPRRAEGLLDIANCDRRHRIPPRSAG